MKEKIGIGIVGCGAQTQLVYLPALKRNKFAEVVAICDNDVRKLNYLAERYNIKHHYQVYNDFIADAEIDAVIVATPNYLHAPMAIGALEYDKDVLVEIPMAVNANEAKIMVKMAEKKKRILMPALNHRLRADVQLIKNFIDGGEIGSLYYCKAGWLRGRTEWSFSGWWGERLRAGGGAFLSLGSQILDIAMYLLAQEKPISIVGTGYKRSPANQVEDSAFALIRLEKQILTIEVGFSMLQDKDFTYFNLFGNKGAALLNPVQIHREMHGHLVNVTPSNISAQKDYVKIAYQLLVDLFVDSVLKKIKPPITGEDGLLINQITDSFYKSYKTQKEVTINW
ncbi:MAG: Gfo/Idh/MocA family oxidoreductase [candidate division WOR-3 bacterium]|nr:Gfo/Idh/MocA family oxidoreductase [candidate division WOR-3 bacterium]